MWVNRNVRGFVAWRSVLWLTVLALLAAAAGAWLASRWREPAIPQMSAGTWLAQPRELAALTLQQSDGVAFSNASLRGHASLVFFGFTHCPDVCPTTLALLAKTQRAANIAGLKIYLISVDPERDNVADLARYVANFNADVLGVTGSASQLALAAKTFGVAVSRVELPGGEYTMDHSATIFLLDDRGRNVAVFTPPFDAGKLVADLLAARGYLTSSGRT